MQTSRTKPHPGFRGFSLSVYIRTNDSSESSQFSMLRSTKSPVVIHNCSAGGAVEMEERLELEASIEE